MNIKKSFVSVLICLLSFVTISIPAQTTGNSTQTEKITVYVTNTGEKYHLVSCRYLKKSSIPTPLEDAAKKYTPCKVCKPPVYTPPESKTDKK